MKVLDTYTKRLQRSFEFCESYWEKAIDNYNHYFGKLSYPKSKNNTEEENVSKLYPFASRVTTGISFDIVETILPRIIGRDPEFITAAFEPEDIPAEGVARMVIESQYDNPKLALLGEPIYLKLQKMVKEALIAGTAVGRGYWRKENVKRPKYNVEIEKTGKSGSVEEMYDYAKEYSSKDLKFIKEEQNYKFLDDFDLKHLPFFFFFPDPMFTEAGRMRYKIERDFYTANELISEAERFGYDPQAVKEALSEEKKAFTPIISKDWLYYYNQLFGSLSNDIFNDDDDKLRVIVIDKMWENGMVWVYANERHCLTPQGMKSPYDTLRDPFIFTHNVTQPHSFFSRSEVDAIKKLEDNINDLINMRNDNLFNAMSSFYLINPVLFEEGGENFLPYPNSVYKVKDIMAALREVKGQDVTAAVYRETAELYGYIQRISGVNDYVKGAEGISLAGRTYGGLRLAQEVANVRFLVKSTLFEQITLRALGYMILEMSRQFINEDRVVRIIGEKSLLYDSDFYKISALELKKIKGFMDIKIIPSSTRAIDEQAEVMKLNGLVDRVGSGRPPFDRITPELHERLLLKYLPLFGFKDASYWIRKMRESVNQGTNSVNQGMNKEKPKTNLPVNKEEVMTTNGIQNQPAGLEQLLANQAEIPNVVDQIKKVNQIPIQNLLS